METKTTKTENLVNPILARQISEKINSDVFDKKQRFEYDVNSFSDLERQQCYEYLKHNGYKAYLNNGFLTAKLVLN